jgi:acetylglutamate kinase
VNRFVVVKLGGNALEAADDLERALDDLARDLLELRAKGVSPVVVHGAGPQISTLLDQLGVVSEFVEGLRVTSDEAMAAVAMALSYVNLTVVAGLNERGVTAQGVSGADRSLLRASLRGQRWGRAGGSVVADGFALESLARDGVVPVVNPVALDSEGRFVNCNADAVAGAVTAALRAEALVLLSDIDQLRTRVEDPSSAVGRVTRAEVLALIEDGSIRDGMLPKMRAAIEALDAGATKVVLANGARPGALGDALDERGVNTEVVE